MQRCSQLLCVTGRQTRRLNILLVFTCTATCFLAFTAVVPIVTSDACTGTPLYVVSFLAAMVMLACAIRVVRAQRREDRNEALRSSQREVPCESERNRAGSIARMEQARMVTLLLCVFLEPSVLLPKSFTHIYSYPAMWVPLCS